MVIRQFGLMIPGARCQVLHACSSGGARRGARCRPPKDSVCAAGRQAVAAGCAVLALAAAAAQPTAVACPPSRPCRQALANALERKAACSQQPTCRCHCCCCCCCRRFCCCPPNPCHAGGPGAAGHRPVHRPRAQGGGRGDARVGAAVCSVLAGARGLPAARAQQGGREGGRAGGQGGREGGVGGRGGSCARCSIVDAGMGPQCSSWMRVQICVHPTVSTATLSEVTVGTRSWLHGLPQQCPPTSLPLQIVASICPELHGLFHVKLATLLMLVRHSTHSMHSAHSTGGGPPSVPARALITGIRSNGLRCCRPQESPSHIAFLWLLVCSLP